MPLEFILKLPIPDNALSKALNTIKIPTYFNRNTRSNYNNPSIRLIKLNQNLTHKQQNKYSFKETIKLSSLNT